MTDWIIIKPDAIPTLVISAWIALTFLGVAIGYDIEQHHKYKDES